jgi:two-component system cell cycle response regulator
MPDAGPRIALKVAERLRLSIAASPAHVRGCAAALPVTVSIGVSSFRGGDDTVDALLRRADRGLYAAKRAGRNRIERVDADEVEAVGPARAS